MTPAQRRAHDATVSILRRYCDEAEAHLRARADAARDVARDKLCPCGIQMTRCQCPLATSRAGAHRVVAGEP